MKILWVCGAGGVGGAETTTVDLLERLRQRGHRTAALCRRGGRVADLLRSAGHIVPAPVGGALNLRTPWAIAHALRALRPDVVLVTTIDEWVWASLVRRPAHTRLVLVRHMALPLSWRVRRLAAARADAVVAVSHAVRRSLLDGRGLAAGQVHVIHNGVRLPPRASVPDAATRAAARHQLGLSADAHWVGFFGGLRREKGIDHVLHAVRSAHREMGPTHLLICGRPPPAGARAASAIAAAYGLTDRVHDLGEITDVTTAFTAVDAVVVATPQRLSEALPATLMEAMACGTPVVAFATGGVPEIIGENEEAGRLARPDDADDLARALLAALRDSTETARRAAAALTRVRALFDPEQATAQYEELFARLNAPEPGTRAGKTSRQARPGEI